MTFAEYRKKALEDLRGLYSAQEATSMFAILMEARGLPSHYYVTSGDSEISSENVSWFNSALSRLMAGEPVSHVVGYREFYGRRFRVCPEVLIPRGETEELCREAIDFCRSRSSCGLDRPLRILDLCTGSGCIGWTVALEVSLRGIPVSVMCVDISEAALKVARSQGFDSRFSFPAGSLSSIEFIQADVLDVEGLCDALGRSCFDLILSNPPYVLESERATLDSLVVDHDPSLALFVPDDDAQKFNLALGSVASRLAAPEGMMMVEINEKLGAESLSALESRLSLPHSGGVVRDLFGRDRFLLLRFRRKNVS